MGALRLGPPGGEPVDRDLGDDDPVGGPELPGVRDVRVHLTDQRMQAIAGVRPGSASGVEQRLAGLGQVGDGGQAQPARQQLQDPLGVVEVVRPGRAVPGRGLGGADQREAEAPPLTRLGARCGRSPCRSRRPRRPPCRGAG